MRLKHTSIRLWFRIKKLYLKTNMRVECIFVAIIQVFKNYLTNFVKVSNFS